MPMLTLLQKSLVSAFLHVLSSTLLWTRGGRTFALPAYWSFACTFDLYIASLSSTLLLLLVLVLTHAAPLFAYSRCSYAMLSTALGFTFSLLALFALVKVAAAAAEGGLFWAQAVLLFSFAYLEGTLAQSAL